MSKKTKALLSDFDDEPSSEVLVENQPKPPASLYRTPVPNLLPTTRGMDYKIAIIGDMPSRDDVDQMTPFSGMSGRMLTNLLAKANILRSACYLGNVCQYSGSYNDEESLTNLGNDLNAVSPNICLILGKSAFAVAKPGASLDSWRGSIFISDTPGPFFGRKCIATYHPSSCIRQYEWTPLLMFDIKKALGESRTPHWSPPIRDLRVNPTFDDLLNDLDKVLLSKPTISIDIEGGVYGMSCISIALSPSYSFIVPFENMDGSSTWSFDEELIILKRLSIILADPAIFKILQNSLYDRFVLQYAYKMVMHGVIDDTMLKHWELYCELEKGLGFLCSLYTKEPYYKGDRKTIDRDTFFAYCCKDSAVTYEISNVLERLLDWTRVPAHKPDQQSELHRSMEHYRFNMALLNPILYMELRGIKYDNKKAKEHLDKTQTHLFALQANLDSLSGCGLRATDSRETILSTVQSIMCFKRDQNSPKKDFIEDYTWIRRRLNDPNPLTPIELTKISIACGLSMNIKSPMFKDFLYEKLHLPKQYKKDKVTGKETLSCDYESLLKIQKKSPHPAVEIALELGELRTRAQMLAIRSDKDGRIRCGYNIVGTETGRLTCYTSPTGSGYNLQTIPSSNKLKPLDHPLRDGMRDLFVADEGFYLFQCDLAGADGWTVAANLAQLGDRTMLDDYLAGIKPAKVLCYMLRHGAASIAGKTRQEIKQLTAPISGSDWDYFACKIVQHGTSYLMGPDTVGDNIFKQSEGKVSMNRTETRDLQSLFMVRYAIKRWHNRVTSNIRDARGAAPKITACSGNTRRFLGRPTALLGEMLAHEPQAITTYATNLAVYNLWNDPDNRVNNGTSCSLRVEPLHQVHDAVCGQFKIEDTEWAKTKIKGWFNNELTIAGQKIIIPFEGAYGSNWALDKASKVGDI